MQQMQVQSLVQEDPLEKEIATHSCVLAGKIPWTEEPGGLQFMGSQRVGYDLVIQHTHTHTQTAFHILFPGIKDRMRPRCHCLINDSQLLPNLLTFLTLSDSTFDGVTDKPILDCCACGTAKYRLTFYGNWSEKTHPKDYPRE